MKGAIEPIAFAAALAIQPLAAVVAAMPIGPSCQLHDVTVLMIMLLDRPIVSVGLEE